MIVEVAAKCRKTVFRGRRGDRHDALYKYHPELLVGTHVQGFLTDEGVFLDRKEAAQHAWQCGQLKAKECPDCVISEELW